jgi:hypothetical protein
MAEALFTSGPASDARYVSVRDGTDPLLKHARYHCEYLWTLFAPYADAKFTSALGREFDARYWEMYLTVSLIVAGHTVTCPETGRTRCRGRSQGAAHLVRGDLPDGGGDPSSPNYAGCSDHVGEEKIILRYLNSISTKYKDQYAAWLKKGIVSANDAFVIALNPRSIPADTSDTETPRILQAGYTLGLPYITVNPATKKMTGAGINFRDRIIKTTKAGEDDSGKAPAEVMTGVFEREEYRGLTALLCSRVDPRQGVSGRAVSASAPSNVEASVCRGIRNSDGSLILVGYPPPVLSRRRSEWPIQLRDHDFGSWR